MFSYNYSIYCYYFSNFLSFSSIFFYIIYIVVIIGLIKFDYAIKYLHLSFSKSIYSTPGY